MAHVAVRALVAAEAGNVIRSRPSKRFGYGEFEEPDGWRSREYLQRQILVEAQSQNPAVLDELVDTVLPLYLAAPEGQIDPDGELIRVQFEGMPFGLLHQWDWHAIKRQAADGDPVLGALREAIEAWAGKWFKDTPNWLMREAVETLDSWRPDRSPADRRDWYFGGELDPVKYHSPTLEDEVPFQFQHAGWPFWRQQMVDWLAELDEAYAAARDTYIQQWTSVANGLGLTPAEEVRKRGEWQIPAFVRFQVLDEDKESILASLAPKATTRRQLDIVFKKIANRAEIKIRLEPRGRPKGKGDRVGGTRR